MSDIMQKYWVVQEAASKDNTTCGMGRLKVAPTQPYVYMDEHDAIRTAKGLAKEHRCAFTVLELVRCYDVCDVVEVEIEN